MKVAILETGTPPGKLAEQFGDYPTMFARMLGPEFEIERFDVAAGLLPDDRGDHAAYLITGSPAGVYEPLPWIAPLCDFIRAAGHAKMVGICFGHQVMAEALGGHVEKSDKGWGAGLHLYSVVQREPWMDGSESIAVPASHQDQVVVQPPNTEIVAQSVVHAVRRIGLDGPAGHLLSVPSGILARVREGADREALRYRARSGSSDRVARCAKRQ